MRIKWRNEKPEKWGQIPDLPFPFKHLIPLFKKKVSSPDSAWLSLFCNLLPF